MNCVGTANEVKKKRCDAGFCPVTPQYLQLGISRRSTFQGFEWRNSPCLISRTRSIRLYRRQLRVKVVLKESRNSTEIPFAASRLSRPEALRPEALRPEALRPEALRPEALRPEALRPEALRPEALRPEALRPEALRPEALRPEALRPGALRPEALCPRPCAKGPCAQRPCAQRPCA